MRLKGFREAGLNQPLRDNEAPDRSLFFQERTTRDRDRRPRISNRRASAL